MRITLEQAKKCEERADSYFRIVDFLEYYVSIDEGSLYITDIKAQDCIYISRGPRETLYERLISCPPINIEVTHVNYIIGCDDPEVVDDESYGILKTYTLTEELNNS